MKDENDMMPEDEGFEQTISPYQLQSSGNAEEQQVARSSFEHESDPPGLDLSFSEILYSASSYHAMVVPVSLTMILAAMSVVFINTEESLIQGEQELSTFYTVFKTDSTSSAHQSTGTNLLYSIGNSFIIVSFICTITFLIVLLYKFRFMKCLIGYMIFSSASLLGFLGSTVATVGIQKYRIPVDQITFYFAIWNFAIVGIVAIFVQTGIPTYITQTYLVCTSVILAWQLSHFDPWTTWSLLVFLALYDLCAVLSPCGPLKALVGLMQQDDAPDMPGLLYEASLPAGAERRVRRTNSSSNRISNGNNNSNSNRIAHSDNRTTNNESSSETALSNTAAENPGTPSSKSKRAASGRTSTNVASPRRNRITNQAIPPERIATIPLAIAKIYRLELLSNAQRRSQAPSSVPLLDESDASELSPAELREMVEVVMPENGGRIVTVGNQLAPKYLVYDREGELKRTLVVDRRGKVMQELPNDGSDEEEDGVSNSIKLGLGDFIFYSVLVSKAAMYSFTTFAACMLCILAGMGATLILLSVYKAALPALPISIFLAVIFYLLTRIVIEPWIQAVMTVPLYL